MSTVHETLLSKALTHFHSELGTEDDTFADVASPEELLEQARALEPLRRRDSGVSGSSFRLENILSHISDFAAILALGSGAGSHVTGAIWGSLKIILMVAHSTGDTFDDVLAMLDELSLALPRFRTYEATLPMTPNLEKALVDVYVEMTCFCARATCPTDAQIKGFLIRAGWTQFDGDFKKTVKRLRYLSQMVDKEADMARLKADEDRNIELIEALESIKLESKGKEMLPLHLVPPHGNKQFFGRDEEMTAIDESFFDKSSKSFQRVLLYGLGGVGKSTLALEYIQSHRKDFDLVVWIAADNEIKVEETISQVAHRLHLIDSEVAVSARSKFTEWLSNSECKWLLVFDNTEDAGVLEIAPTSDTGSIMITSRDPTITFGTTSSNFHIKPFGIPEGSSALLTLLGRDNGSDTEEYNAVRIVETLGGLPLAISQISGFIAQQQLSMEGFLPFYERNAAKIHARGARNNRYEHTLSTVWEMAFDKAPPNSRRLQNLLAFFDPDRIHESVLMDGVPHVDGSDLEFIMDDLEFLDAKEELLRSSLLHREATDSTISMHRLVQAAVIQRMSSQERTDYLDNAIIILSHGFDNSWNVVTSHQYSNWARCDLRVTHVQSLVVQTRKYKIRASRPKDFAELVFRCAWHLYERELYAPSIEFLDFGSSILEETDTLTYASVCTLRGLVQLDKNEIHQALDSFSTGLQIREKLLPSDDAFIASSLNAMSLAYTECNQLDEAIMYGNRAIDIRIAVKSDRIGNSYSNMASTLLRLGKPSDAEEMLSRCPSLKDFTDQTFLGSGNPRFAGDMILLSRIRQQQDRIDEAVRLASKALTFRQRTHGNHLKTCDTMQLVASMMQDRGDSDSAIAFWSESESVAKQLPEAAAYTVRAQYKLATCHGQVGDERTSNLWKTTADAAHVQYMKRQGKGLLAPDSPEDFYDSRVPWMLW